jgi:hypothetical protein
MPRPSTTSGSTCEHSAAPRCAARRRGARANASVGAG